MEPAWSIAKATDSVRRSKVAVNRRRVRIAYPTDSKLLQMDSLPSLANNRPFPGRFFYLSIKDWYWLRLEHKPAG